MWRLPDPLPTNIRFGGSGMRTAYVTLSALSASDSPVATDGPPPGLRLNFSVDVGQVAEPRVFSRDA